MKVLIKETGEIKELIYYSNDINIAGDIIGNEGALQDQFTYNEEQDLFETDEENFAWWENFLNNIE